MSMLAKIAAASMTGGGNNIRDGKYKCLIEKISYDKKHNGEMFIAELRVIEAQPSGEFQINPDGKTVNNNPVAPNPVNSTMSMVANLTKHESALGNVKKFVYAALRGLKGDLPEEAVTEQVLLDAVGPQQPLTGFAIECETYRTVNKGRSVAANAGNILVLQKWDAIAQDTQAIKTQREWLGSNKASAQPAPAAAPTPAQPTAPPPTAPAASSGGLMGLIK